MSSHRLEVEAGRWARPVRVDYDERKCRICSKLEDEFHFIFECPIYTDLRKLYIDKYYLIRPSMFKLIELLTTNRKKQIRNLGIFIYKAFEERNKQLYISDILHE